MRAVLSVNIFHKSISSRMDMLAVLSLHISLTSGLILLDVKIVFISRLVIPKKKKSRKEAS